jgi:hypothetical protein
MSEVQPIWIIPSVSTVTSYINLPCDETGILKQIDSKVQLQFL